MNKILMASVSVVALTAVASPAMAGNPYLQLGAGFATGSERDWDRDPPPRTVIFTTGAQEFHGGPAFEAAIGYDVGPVWNNTGIRVELQATYINYDVGRVQFGGPSSDSPSSAPPNGSRVGDLTETLLMANVLVDIDLGIPLTPYVGVGIGFALSNLDSGGTGSTPPFMQFDGLDDVGLAWQIILGASVAVAPNLDVYGNYRLIGLPGFEGPDIEAAAGNAGAGHTDFDSDLSHAITVGIRYNFM